MRTRRSYSRQHSSIDLGIFHVDPQRGFLPAPDPLRRLPAAFAPWEGIAHDLPKLLVAGTIRRELDQLPMLKVFALSNHGQLERAMLLLSYFGHAYMWGEVTPASRLPASVAVPWYAVA